MKIIRNWIEENVKKFFLLVATVVLLVIFMEGFEFNTPGVFRRGLALATPIALVAMGETISERAGIINVGVEGMTLFGAMVAAWITLNSNIYLGALGGILGAGFLGLIHAYWCIRWRANQIVSGIAINIMTLGLASVIPALFGGRRGTWSGFATLNPWMLVALMLGIVVIVQVVLYKTLWGLRLRTAGDRPEAVDTAGGNVPRIRYTAMLLNGLLCGLAGVWLISYSGSFTDGIVAGRGFMGIAATVVGGYVPIWAFGSSFLFGFVFSLQQALQQFIPNQFAQMLPYIATIIVMAGLLGRIEVPEALGKHYIRE
ncbi:MAG: ABC transporter permease [Candidatus Hadarchaeota archaeon]